MNVSKACRRGVAVNYKPVRVGTIRNYKAHRLEGRVEETTVSKIDQTRRKGKAWGDGNLLALAAIAFKVGLAPCCEFRLFLLAHRRRCTQDPSS